MTPTDNPGILHAYKCPHCRRVQAWEIGLNDKLREWDTRCPSCGADVIVRYDAARDAVTGYAP